MDVETAFLEYVEHRFVLHQHLCCEPQQTLALGQQGQVGQQDTADAQIVVFIPDGESDISGVHILVDAELADTKNDLPFVPFETFHDVIAEISKDDFAARLEAEVGRDLERKTTLPGPEIHAENAEGRNPYDKCR